MPNSRDRDSPRFYEKCGRFAFSPRPNDLDKMSDQRSSLDDANSPWSPGNPMNELTNDAKPYPF